MVNFKNRIRSLQGQTKWASPFASTITGGWLHASLRSYCATLRGKSHAYGFWFAAQTARSVVRILFRVPTILNPLRYRWGFCCGLLKIKDSKFARANQMRAFASTLAGGQLHASLRSFYATLRGKSHAYGFWFATQTARCVVRILCAYLNRLMFYLYGLASLALEVA